MDTQKQQLEQYIRENTAGGAHVCINVKNMEESYRFYTELLGFHHVTSTDIGTHHLVFLHTRNMTLELVAVDDEPQPSGTGMFCHICMFCEEDAMNELLSCFEKLGYPVLERCRWNPTVYGRGSSCFFIEGPNGEQIEYNTLPKDGGYAYFEK